MSLAAAERLSMPTGTRELSSSSSSRTVTATARRLCPPSSSSPTHCTGRGVARSNRAMNVKPMWNLMAFVVLVASSNYRSQLLVSAAAASTTTTATATADIENEFIFDEANSLSEMGGGGLFGKEHGVRSSSAHHGQGSHSANAIEDPISSPIQQILEEKHDDSFWKGALVDNDNSVNDSSSSSSISEKRSKMKFGMFEDDDEDYVDDEQSSGSGWGGAGETSPKPEAHTPSPDQHKPVFFRMTLNLTSSKYNDNLASRSSQEFESLSDDIVSNIEPLYDNTNGRQVVTVLSFEPTGSGCLATVDLGTVEYYDERALRGILMQGLSRGQLGNLRVSPDGFTFRQVRAESGPIAPIPPCDDNEFTCASNECVDLSKRCNGVADCADGDSDERNCPVVTLRPVPVPVPAADRGCRSDDQIQCQVDGSCIDSARLCDGTRDCPDGEDEIECEQVLCSAGQFLCDSTRCVREDQRCDQSMDCFDGTDESNCPDAQQHQCQPDEFRCQSGECMESFRRCDFIPDCPAGDDEQHCNDQRCSSEQFQCSDRTCIPAKSHCDGRYDCSDGYDEINCRTCQATEFPCVSNGLCIDIRRRCDGFNDCQDKSDENDCPPSCASNEFRCGDGSCIQEFLRCNGNYDCADFSDERNCDTPVHPTREACNASQITCGDGNCVTRSKQCDGRFDCIDGTDERDCAKCSLDKFRCEDGVCIDRAYRCDGRPDCRDRSDELDCRDPVRGCSTGEFTCQDSSCISELSHCDGRRDCQDGSDEINCASCQPGLFRCSDGNCISEAYRCDGRSDCRDGADERECGRCAYWQFQCSDDTCIDARRRCDGQYDCLDGYDEYYCDRCQAGQFRCNDTTCIDSQQRCDGRPDCRDRSDETGCGPTCTPEEFACDSGQLCVDKRRKCDGHQDCPDRSDERGCAVCALGLFACGDGQCIDMRSRCNGYYDCTDYSDEANCVTQCRSDQFTCSSNQCVEKYRQCDGVYDCNDGSDERNCVHDCHQHEHVCGDGRTCVDVTRLCDGAYDCDDRSDEKNCARVCPASDFRCQDGQCIHNDKNCDGKYDCVDGSDEEDCGEFKPCGFGQFYCKNGPACFSVDARCDGRFDCPDISDELNCPHRGSISLRTYPDSQTIKQGREVVFECRDEGTQRAAVIWKRGADLALPPGSTSLHGRLTMPNIQVEHSGTYICSATGVIPTPTQSQRIVSLTVEPFALPTDPPKGFCDRNQATCQNGDCVPRRYICDGDIDCSDGSDETSCRPEQSKCQPNEFQCNNNLCILKIWRCDGEDDCGDNSDEQTCATVEYDADCTYKEYRCQTQKQCIPKSFQCDNEIDCQDRTDEIGCGPPTVVDAPEGTVMVNVGETVTILCTAVGTPTPFISWRLNWGHIPPPPRVTTSSVEGVGVLTIREAQESDQGAYSCEAINSKDIVLAKTDAQLVVKPVAGACQPPYFNANAKNSGDCLPCFCFRHSEQCFSSSAQYSQLPHGTEISIIAVSVSPSGTYSFDSSRHALNQDFIFHLPENREFKIDDRIYQRQPNNLVYYWKLPTPFLGNKLNSYGGSLKFSVLYRARPGAKRIPAPDVILKGNGLTFYYQTREPSREEIVNEIDVRFWESVWVKMRVPDYPDSKTDGWALRDEIMFALENIESIYIRASYVDDFTESSLIGLQMDVAVNEDVGKTRAVFVEQCTCPSGYNGSSCESCSPGYTRVRTGNYLGDCRRSQCECNGHSDQCDGAGNCFTCQHNTAGGRCEHCKSGFYGDARRGSQSDCQPCPCPLTFPSNQFSPTCFLDNDDNPTCNACPEGYVGRRCERCAPGYIGDPTVPGLSCTASQSICDPVGSLSPIRDPRTGLCQCKDFVAGPTCSQCQPDYFHLNEHSLGGCIDCFCMGVSKQCSSSRLYRSEESAVFSADNIEFNLSSFDLSENVTNGLLVSTGTRELVFRDFSSLTPGKNYYWRLPERFLGNKITSYGGNLTYTVRFSASSDGLRNPGPDIQLTGHRITLEYTHSSQPQSYSTQTVTVPLYERYWMRPDGQPATREHMLMALGELEILLIKAMYSSNMRESSIRDVKLETTVAYDTRQSHALEVEQCRCPIGYRGTSCEECDVGFSRTGSGLYYGLCDACFCNGHSSDCHPDTGICRNCQHNTEGDFCELCAPNYSGDASGGTPNDCQDTPEKLCRCDARGTVRDDCDVSTQCYCKNNVEGQNCNQCRRGFYNLDTYNPQGCSRCFCFGVTDQCTSGPYYRTQIRPIISEIEGHGFTLTDRYESTHRKHGIGVNRDRNGVSFVGFRPIDSQTYYWSLPEVFTGNMLLSYGGKLRFELHYIVQKRVATYQDVDVILKGGGDLSLFYTRPTATQPAKNEYFEVELSEEHWQHADSQKPGREIMMTILANVQSILIRASISTSMVSVTLSNVTLDSGSPQPVEPEEPIYTVEQCSCTPGYIGLSCEECAPGYIRVQSHTGGKGQCVACNCHGHSDTCDLNTRQCQQCRDNTVGPNCERCANGFYGDATIGTPWDCNPCPCPLTIPSNQFSRSCYVDSDGLPTCQACPLSHTGRNCELCAPGYQGNPSRPGDTCIPSGHAKEIVVRIHEPKYHELNEGDSVSLICVGYSQVRDGKRAKSSSRRKHVTYNLVWTREDRRPLPTYSEEAAGILNIRGVRTSDEGTYVCTGSNPYGESIDRAVIRVTSMPSSAPIVRVEPRSLEIEANQPANFRCIASGVPRPAIMWTRGRNSALNPFSTVQDGVLHIPTVTKADEGEYYCTASNSFGTDSGRAVLYVTEGSHGQFNVSILPQRYDARPGETVRFDCRVDGAVAASISWTRVGAPMPLHAMQHDHFLIFSNVDDSYRGFYVCTVRTLSAGTQQAQATLNIHTDAERPTAKIEPEQQTIAQGSSAELRCIVTGEPLPIVTWSKSGEELPENHQIVGNTLRIPNVKVPDRGVYVCLATSGHQQAQTSCILEVERREPPAIELYPGSSQTVDEGGSVLFQCRIVAGDPYPDVEWTREDRKPIGGRIQIHSGGVLRIDNIVYEDQGAYLCTARNIAGQTSATAMLIVSGLPEINISPASPHTVTVGQRVQMLCYAKGSPSPSVYWTPEQSNLRFVSRSESVESTAPDGTKLATYEINDVQFEHAGYYICHAESSGGKTSKQRFQLIVSGTPSISRPQADEFIVKEGSVAELRCSVVSENDTFTIQWFRADRRPLPVAHITSARGGILTLRSVHKDDAGEYVCIGMRNNTIHFSVSTQVIVIAPPRLSVSPVTMTARPGETVAFRCYANGDDPIHIDWQKVSGTISPSVVIRGGDLIFQGVSVADAGRYVCSARNHVGQAEGTVEVYVNEYGCHPSDVQCASTRCVTVGDCPNTEQGQQQGDTSNEVASNQIRSTCHDRYGRPIDCTDERPYVSAEQPEQTVSVGFTVELVCVVNDWQRPNVTWSRDQGDLPINSQFSHNRLRILNVRVEDGGQYICTATNEYGSRHASTLLNVQGISNLKVHIVPKPHNVQIGDNLDVQCVTDGEEGLKISWTRIGGSLPANARVVSNTLHFTRVRPEDNGDYQCHVQSYSASFRETYKLALPNIPALQQTDQVDHKKVPLGSTAVLDCTEKNGDGGSDASPQPVRYVWTKKGGPVPANATVRDSRLTLTDVRVSDAGTYVCNARDARSSHEVSKVLTVTNVVPYFTQAPLSYMSLPTLPDAYLQFDIELSFKPESEDGLILYNGQKSAASAGSDVSPMGFTKGFVDQQVGANAGDFMSFGLSNGYAEFRFEVGSGPAVIRSEERLSLGEWHTVKLHRNKKAGEMEITGQPSVNGSAGGRYQGLDLIEPLYVGGVPNFDRIHKLSGFSRGFVGCISRLIIGSTTHELPRDAVASQGVTTCEICTSNPCTNDGFCQEAYSPIGYTCICLPGFTGVHCQKVGESCYPGFCGTGHCVDKPNGFVCHCPYGKSGRQCEKDITIYEAAFRGDAFVAYPTPRALRKLKFSLTFKASRLTDGLLLYCAQNETGHGDFVSLSIRDGKVEFRFDTGSGTAVLRSTHELKEEEWVSLKAERNLREGTLTVDDEPEVHGMSPGQTRGLNLRTLLYIGGVDKSRVHLSPFVGVERGFDGCVSHLEVADLVVDMANAHVESANVNDCGGQASCQRKPCLNDGKCVDLADASPPYECHCKKGYSGRNCEIEENVCKIISPCENGGTCLATAGSSTYRCSCPVGFAGTNCDESVDLSTSVSFQGDGYVELDGDLLPHTSSIVNEVITLAFETTEKNGLLLWHGQRHDEDGKGRDYLALAIVDGYLEFSYELGSGAALLHSSILINDGIKHRVILKRTGRDGSMELDDIYKEYGESQGILQMLNTRGNIYIGGLPNLSSMTAGQHSSGFVGCLSELEIQDSGAIDMKAKSVGGANVFTCAASGSTVVADEGDVDDNTISA